ncbi:carbohydrate ABC transporter permease [Paenibacillus cymbidii]|uniref:carbohydrate ABC transporter permease n=1 Tax=Paenibacillus cymbidii TaxID=1639034 RepID=UPI001080B059|nr:carbohydrate ABC transporter permease [Paenibacillus cymbidii]
MATNKLLTALKFLLLIVASCAVVLPIWLLFVSSFRQTTNVLTYPPKLWPDDGDFANYRELFAGTRYQFGRWFLNSALVAGVSTAFCLLVSAMAGYAFARRTFPGKKTIFALILSTMMVPGIVTLIPGFLIVDRLGWTNSYWGLVVPTVASTFGVFLMRQFIQVLPSELEESARLDGCSDYGAFFKIILPMTAPSLGVLAIFHFIGNWGSLIWPLVITTEAKMQTLPVGIAGMKTFESNTSGTIMAATFLSFIPLFIVFLFAREKFIEGVTAGAVKG